MTDGMTAVTCADCRHAFADFEAALREADRPPCPECGGTERIAYVEASDSISVHESCALKGRPASGGRPFLLAVHDKLEWFRRSGRWHVVTRVVNRRDDQYHERIVDRETGSVVREVHEPLSQHRGHGSARRP